MYLMKSPKYIGGLIVSTKSSPISSPMTRRIHLSNQTPSSRLTNLLFISSLVEKWKLKFVLKWNTVYSFEFARSYIHSTPNFFKQKLDLNVPFLIASLYFYLYILYKSS